MPIFTFEGTPNGTLANSSMTCQINTAGANPGQIVSIGARLDTPRGSAKTTWISEAVVFNNGKGAQIVVSNNGASILQWWGTVVIEAASQPSSPTFAYYAPTS